MNNKLSNRGRALLAVIMVISLVAVLAMDRSSYGESGSKKEDKAKAVSEANEASAITPAASADDKEMVYVLQKPDGKEYERIVSADGKLHYKGYEDALLPVDMEVTYLLDDEPVAPEDLPGEEGHLQIIFKYENKLQAGNVNVPLMAITAAVLDNEKFSNVEVKPGRILDDGSRTIAMGFCLPGMSDSLGLTEEESGLYDMMMIECDTKDYEVNEMYTIVTDDPFKELGLDQADSLGDLSSKLGQLEDGATQLTEGTEKLSSGSVKLAKGMKELNTAAGSIDDGASQVADGVKKIDKSMPDLTKGAGSLQKGAKAVSDGNKGLYKSLVKMYGESPSGSNPQGSGTLALRAGTKQLAEGAGKLNSQVEKAAAEVEKYSKEHDITLADVKAMTEDAEKQVEQLMSLDAQGDAKKLQDGIDQYWQLYSKEGATDEEKAEAKAKINEMNQQLGQVKSAGETQQKIAKLADAIGEMKKAYDDMDPDKFDKAVANLEDAQKSIKALSEGASQVDAAVGEINVALAGKNGKGKGTDNLIGAARALSDGSGQVYDGVLSLAGGSKKLADGISKLAKGSEDLAEGTDAFADGQNAAYKGMLTLAGGAGELDKAIKQAIGEVEANLAGLPTEKITAVLDNLGPLQQAAKGYKGFGGKKTYDSVTFIYKMDKVGK